MVEQIRNVMVRWGASWVIWLPVGLSVLSIAVMLDRARVYWAQREDVTELLEDLHDLLGRVDLGDAHRRLSKSSGAAVMAALAGLAQWYKGARAAAEAMAAATGLQRAGPEKRILIREQRAFVGLVWTVIGVVVAFEELGRSSTAAAAAGRGGRRRDRQRSRQNPDPHRHAGTPRSVAVLGDPGHGFGREAQRRAMRKCWVPALDYDGVPLEGTVTVNVRFDR